MDRFRKWDLFAECLAKSPNSAAAMNAYLMKMVAAGDKRAIKVLEEKRAKNARKKQLKRPELWEKREAARMENVKRAADVAAELSALRAGLPRDR